MDIARYSCQSLIKLEFSVDFRSILKSRISQKSIRQGLSYSMRTDKHDEGNSRFSRFYERAYKLLKTLVRNARIPALR
jgi:hypothetical protein